MSSLCFGNLWFSPDMLLARREDGTEIRFTRQERVLLLRFTRQPRRLLTRSYLQDALGDRASLRSVDLIVNRLRTRLDDSAREPRYIATQYGEGYVWVAEQRQPSPVSALLAVGPAFGAQGEAEALGVLPRLADDMGRLVGRPQDIICLPGRDLPADNGSQIRYRLDVCFHRDRGQWHTAFVLRDGLTRQPIQTVRLQSQGAPDDVALGGVSRTVRDAIWAHSASASGLPGLPSDPPLHVRLHDAARLLTGDGLSWRESRARLQDQDALAPDDPAVAVMQALGLFLQLIQNVHYIDQGLPALDDDGWREVEDRIELLALGSLPAARRDPLLALGVAKVLHFVHRRHDTLVRSLLDDAFAQGAAFAAVFSLRGELAVAEGQIDRALGYYDSAIELAEPGSEFHVYLRVLKCVALLSAGRRAELALLADELYADAPDSRRTVGFIFISPRAVRLAPDWEAQLSGWPPSAARAMLMQLYRVFVRQCRRPVQQRHLLRGLATQLVARFGPDVLPPPVRTLLPGLG